MSKGLVGYTPGASGSWAEEEPRTLLSSQVPAKGQSAYLKYDLFKEKTDDLSRDTKGVRRDMDELQQELRDKLEDLSNKQDELEDLTAQSFSKVKDVLTKSEKEVRGLRSEVSHASTCLGKMGGAVKKARSGAQTSEERLAELEAANDKLAGRLKTTVDGLDKLGAPCPLRGCAAPPVRC